MKRFLLVLSTLYLSSCTSITNNRLYLGLSFSSYDASPVVMTHFSIEQPLVEIHPELVLGRADIAMPRSYGSNVLSPPYDINKDKKWRISAQWVELLTSRAYRAEVEVPINKLTVDYGGYNVIVIFAPNGLLLIGSDKVGNQVSDRIDVVAVCGQRMTSADAVWRDKTGYFPELEYILKDKPHAPVEQGCQLPFL